MFFIRVTATHSEKKCVFTSIGDFYEVNTALIM